MSSVPSEFEAFAGAFQFAYVARDVRRAARAFEARYGPVPFQFHEVTVACRTQPATCSLRVGIAWIADKQIELIEPVAGAIELYVRALPAHGDALAFHHVGVRVHGTLQEWDNWRSELLSRGERLALEGGFADTLRFAYLDTADRLGHYIEYIWLGAVFLSEQAATAYRPH